MIKMNRIKNPFFIDNREYEHVQDEACEQNRKVINYFFSFTSVLMVALFSLSFIYKPYVALRLPYILAFTLSIFLLVLVNKTSKHELKSTLFAVYLSATVFLVYGMSLSWNSPDNYSVTFIGVLLIASMIYIEKPRRFAIFIMGFIIAFIIMVLKVKTSRVCMTEIVNVLCFGIVSIVINHILVKVKMDNLILAKRLKYLSEMDKLTDLHNRNSYESKLVTYEKNQSELLACIYVDVNGLHQLNNTQGHEAGDKMLQFVATKLKEFYGNIHTYRIGGDEFVAFVFGKDEEEIKKSTDLFRKEIIDGNYHVSLGYECCKEAVSIKEVIKKAEQKMYIDKKEYYKNSHTDRRGKWRLEDDCNRKER